MIVLDVDADELPEDDEHDRALEERTDERPKEPEDGVLVAELEFAEREEIKQIPRSPHLAIDTYTPILGRPISLASVTQIRLLVRSTAVGVDR
jgi:hypothetical protein